MSVLLVTVLTGFVFASRKLLHSTHFMEVKYNCSGYRQFRDPNTGRWVFTHRRVGEKKIGRALSSTEVVHHINKDKTDNRYSNLVVIEQHIHQTIHSSPHHERNACFRCGRTSHWAQDCYARTDCDGNSL